MELKGLTSEEARKRLQTYGKNEIVRKKKVSPFKIFLSQFTSPLIILLIFAALISFFINYFKHENYFDSILILIIVFASALAGFVQEYKAERAIEALKKLAKPKAKVIRDGKEQEIPASEIVLEDLIVVESGDVVPADSVIIDGNLEVDESILTGESIAVKKKKDDKIFSDCPIYAGKAIAQVFATGMKTEIGKIAEKMQEIKETKTPFQAHMENFTKKIVLLTLLIIGITFAVGVSKLGFIESFLIAISLAVAAIPEGLPAVITLALSLGARDMAKKNALIRRLPVTESIGCCDVICVDKTGTITEGKMKVGKIWLIEESKEAEKLALECCYYCNNAKKILKEGKEIWVGDETDVALKEFALEKVKERGKRIDEIPFTSERKMMSVVHEFENEKIIFSKGATEVILNKSTKALFGDRIVELDKSLREKILKTNEEFASQAFRIIALAYKNYGKFEEENLTFIGLAILSDPPRKEVKEALEECYSAGIRVIMLTGDNPETARAVAKEVGLKSKGVVTGEELEKLSEEDLKKVLSKGINIFARISPFHKLKILEVLQKEGHVVAMSGDGVNDALALKKADVGVSMGIKGTEVAKEASDMVLLDDNFATIRTAIKEGRRIFDNIRKFVNYLITCNIAEVAVVLLATLLPFFNFILLYPVQILWVNLITDGLPALALSVDPARPDVMKRRPRKKEEGIIDKKMALLIGGIGVKKSSVLLGTFFASLPFGLERARSTLFTGFIMYEFVRIAVIRYSEKLGSLKDWIANKFLVASLAISLILQLILLYTPLASFFKVVPLGFGEWEILLVGTLIGFITGILITRALDKIIKD